MSVLEAKDCGSGKYELTMQSGDTISVVAPNYAIKVTAEWMPVSNEHPERPHLILVVRY